MKDQMRWQLLSEMGFSKKAIDILEQNLNMGIMDNPSITAQHQGTCGDILMLSLQIKDNYIQDAMYEYIGCAGLQACASALTEIVKQKDINTLLNLGVSEIIEYLESIPESKYECAEIARNTLIIAINEYNKVQKES